MPHIPKSKSTSKDVRAAIRYVQESATGLASTAANREKENARMRARLYSDSKIKEMLLKDITQKMVEIRNSNRADTMDMYQIVSELCKDGVMNEIVFKVADEIVQLDNNPDCSVKINPTGINLCKTIERDYMLYMIEFLIRAEVERMRNKKIENQEIIKVLRLEKSGNYEQRGKAIRLRVRQIVRFLYGAEESEQRIDKLREETRNIMKSIASNMELKEVGTQYQNAVMDVGNDSNPDASDR